MKMNNKGQSPKKGFFGSSSKISILPIVIILIISAIGFYLLFNDIYLGQETEKPNYCDNHDNIRQEDPYIFTNPTKIENSNGNAWDAIAENIQLAINDLGALGGDVWVPPGEYDVFENIEIYSDGTRIHGSGDSTLFILHDDSKIYSNDNDDILIENFKVTGSGKIWLILGDNTFVRDINAYNITAPWDRAFTFFNFMLTNGMDRSGLLVENCHVNRCTLSGFMIYAELPGSVLEDICFDNCSANYCGWDVDGTPQQSPWSVGFVFNECKNHPDFHNLFPL